VVVAADGGAQVRHVLGQPEVEVAPQFLPSVR
jgi:hypothetical protein